MMSKYLFSRQVLIFTKLSRSDQDIVLMNDDSSELFPMLQISTDPSFSDTSDAEEEIPTTPTLTTAPRAVMYQPKPKEISVRERAKEYERQRESERQMIKPLPRPNL